MLIEWIDMIFEIWFDDDSETRKAVHQWRMIEAQK